MNFKNKKEFLGAIIGMLLGDGCIKQDRSALCLTSVIREYAEWKKEMLDYLTDTSISEYEHKNGFGNKNIFEVRTRQHPVYQKLRMRFYHNGKRQITEFAMKNITPLGILIWYLDDGCLDDACGLKFQIHSNSYSEIEHQYIQKMLNDRFGLRFNVRKKFQKKEGKIYYWLYLKAIDRLKFWDKIIAPYYNEIPQQIKYKVPLRDSIEKLMESKNHKRFYEDIV